MNHEKQNEGMEASFYFKYKYLATLKYNLIATVIVFLLFNIPTLIIFLTVPIPSHPTNVTECFNYFFYIISAQSGLQAVFLNYLVYKFWGLIDPYNIKTEFAIMLGSGYLGISVWTILQSVDIATHTSLFPMAFQPMYIQNTTILWIILSMVFYPLYLIYKEKKKEKGEFIFANVSPNALDIHLHNILANEHYLQVFKEVTIQYWCVESLLFVVDVEHYKKLLDDHKREQFAQRIYNSYFNPESPLYINVNASVASTVQERIKDKDFAPTLFFAAES